MLLGGNMFNLRLFEDEKKNLNIHNRAVGRFENLVGNVFLKEKVLLLFQPKSGGGMGN